MSQQVDPLVVEPDFHQDNPIHQALLGELAQLADIAQVGRPQDEAVAQVSGDFICAGDELQLCDAQSAFGCWEQQGDDLAALAGQATSQDIGAIAKLIHHSKNMLAGLFRNRPRPVQSIRDGAD